MVPHGYWAEGDAGSFVDERMINLGLQDSHKLT